MLCYQHHSTPNVCMAASSRTESHKPYVTFAFQSQILIRLPPLEGSTPPWLKLRGDGAGDAASKKSWCMSGEGEWVGNPVMG